MQEKEFPAHIRTDGNIKSVQSVTEHLRNVAGLCKAKLSAVNLSQTGYLAGLIHDMGKFTSDFAEYIQKAAAGENVRRGSVNHTFASCRFMWSAYHKRELKQESDIVENLACEVIILAVVGHHGQFDCYDKDGRSGFEHRADFSVNYDESVENFFNYCASETVGGALQPQRRKRGFSSGLLCGMGK